MYKVKYFFGDKISPNFHIKIKQEFSNLSFVEDNNFDYLIIVGGDGTLLYGLREFGIDKKVIFLSTGKIGFFQTINLDDFFQNPKCIEEALKNKSYEDLPLIESKVESETFYALNEIRVVRLERTVKLGIYFNENPFNTHYVGSGICVSTAHGSTGFNTSNGFGPWLFDKNNFVLSFLEPIVNSSHRNSYNPVVLNKNTRVILKNNCYTETYLVFDTSKKLLKNNLNIEIFISNKVCRILKLNSDFDKAWLSKINQTFLQ